MERDLQQLSTTEFDVLVIGGGAFGAAAARDAALRGLSTALIERADFGGGVSANCFKMVHGGIRYLQHADIPRLRYSCAERSAWLRIAPHLVSPLPIVVPTYGRGRKGRAFLRTGMAVYDLLTTGKNADIPDPSRHIRPCRSMSRAQVLDLFPAIEDPALTGAAVFDDAQMHNPSRLVLAMVTSAVTAGAVACNYVEATALIREGSSIKGAVVNDVIDGSSYRVRARLVLNAAGPWAESLFSPSRARQIVYSRDAFLTLRRRPASEYGLAVPGQTRDHDAVLGRATRHLFLAPWRDRLLLGVWHKIFKGQPDSAAVSRDEVSNWIAEINASCPALAVREDEVSFTSFGLLPFGGESGEGRALSFGKQSHIIDHRKTQGVSGLVTLIGNRYTTARGDSESALNVLLRQRGVPPPPTATDRVPLTGGAISSLSALRGQLTRDYPSIGQATIDALIANHGSLARDVLTPPGIPRQRDAELAVIPGTTTLYAEITHAVLRESAMRLEDVVLRRTELAAGFHPGRQVLAAAAFHMSALLGWSHKREQIEVDACHQALGRHDAREPFRETPTLRMVRP